MKDYNRKSLTIAQPMSDVIFESMISQLRYMSPSQLRELQQQIAESLNDVNSSLLTEDELYLIASLFKPKHKVACQ